MSHLGYSVLAAEDMIRLKHNSHSLTGKSTFSASACLAKIQAQLRITDKTSPGYQWFEAGVEIKLLQVGKSNLGWQRSLARFCVVFQADGAIEQPPKIQGSCIIPTNDDVFDLVDSNTTILNLPTTTIRDFYAQICQAMGIPVDASQVKYYWFDDRGIECEVLRSTGEVSGWQPGLVRIQLEFIPKVAMSEPENTVIETSGLSNIQGNDSQSPLDPLRA